MRFSYKNLPISKKLFLSNLAFALPMAVLIFFMNISFDYDINIGKAELAGTRSLQSLFSLLDCIPDHFFAPPQKKQAAEQKIMAAFAALRQAEHETADRTKSASSPERPTALSADTLNKRWLSLRRENAPFADYGRLQEEILGLISQTGRSSRLILDPAMDSKLLAEVLISRLPANCNALTRFFHLVTNNSAYSKGNGSVLMTMPDSPLARELRRDLILYRAELAKISADSNLVLAEDPDFYGKSPSLHRRLPPALADYQSAAQTFLMLFDGMAEQPMAYEEYLAAGSAARKACLRLFVVGLEELEILINKRIASYRRWQTLGFASSGAALLLASFFIFTIAKNITHPIRAIIGYTRKISRGDFNAALAGDFHGELGNLADDLHAMVKEILRLAAFPRENPNPVLGADQTGAVIYENKATGKIVKTLSVAMEDFLPGNHRDIVAACLASGRNRAEIETRTKEAVFSWTYHPLPDQQLVHIYARDITAQKQLEEQLQHDAFHDGLTDLPNRALFTDRLQHVLKRHDTDSAPFAVLFLDLDRFKLINDSLGHATGDQLLIAVAHRINTMTAAADTLARLGGDEFTLLLENTDLTGAITVAERILNGLAEPFAIGAYELTVTTSIGLVINSSKTESAEEILRDADTAMYRAKAQGGNSYALFDDTMHQVALERLETEMALKKGIERDEFVVFYQPIVDLQDGRIAGFEALVRWLHPEKGLIPPGLFIPLAEESGLIIPIGKAVLTKACKQAKAWQQMPGYDQLLISVNLAVPQLTAKNIMEEIDAALALSNLPPETLKLEITESGIMNNVEAALEVLAKIKERNITLGIDDFGTGYSSLSYLHRFPFDTLKVDRSFVIEMEKDARNLAIIKTIVNLAHSLDKKVIVEGIETESQLAQIRQLDCAYGQGFYFAKPVGADEAAQLLRAPPFATG